MSGKLNESEEEEDLPGFNAPVFTEEFLKHNESKFSFLLPTINLSLCWKTPTKSLHIPHKKKNPDSLFMLGESAQSKPSLTG